ncbi:MAG TPA: DUF87 domain-containing protein [Solirubrobacterales bacterium]
MVGEIIAPPRSGLSQPARLVIAITYVGGLLLLGIYLNDQFLPPFGVSGLWFYAAFAALILGDFILEPFFTRPADALANGVALVFAAASVSLAGVEISESAAKAGRAVLIGFGFVVIALAVLAVVFKDSTGFRATISRYSAFIVARIGRGRVLWSIVLFAVGYAAFADSASKIAALYLAWIVIFAVGPLERIARLFRQRPKVASPAGVIERIEDPGIAVARFPSGTVLKLGGQLRIEETGAVGTIVDLTTLVDEPAVRIAFDGGANTPIGASLESLDALDGDSVIGHVGDGTTLAELHIETAPQAAAAGLEEARLVSTSLDGHEVLYQIIEALVRPEREDRFRRDYVRVSGRKLGVWDENKTTFEPVPWIPLPGTPVRLLGKVGEDHFSPGEVGHVPGTSYGISIDMHRAVTHNTAILGILGVGKTHLAWELIQRMLIEGIKVVVLDLTGQYAVHFQDVCPPETEQAITARINEAIAGKLDSKLEVDGQAGNILEFKDEIEDLLSQFMVGDERLLILNPTRFEVSRMEGRPFSGSANLLVKLSPVEITQIISEALLALVQSEFSERAKVCLILDEAHSLVPEWNSTVNEGEKSAVNGTARAILQGRKYGFGCFLITQRTANVTKSILNQCNTIFALRIYDATGMGFLENYVGASHAQLLAALPDRQAVVFGRASSCNSPIIIRLNEEAQVRSELWEPVLKEIPTTSSDFQDVSTEETPPETGDEPPF